MMTSLLSLTHPPRQAVAPPHPPGIQAASCLCLDLATYHLLGLSLSFGVLEIRNSTLVPRPAWISNSCLHPGGGNRWPMKMLSVKCPLSNAHGSFYLSIDGCNLFASCLDPLSNLHWLPALCLSQPHLLAEPSSEPQNPKWTCPVVQPWTLMAAGCLWGKTMPRPHSTPTPITPLP